VCTREPPTEGWPQAGVGRQLALLTDYPPLRLSEGGELQARRLEALS